MRCKLLLAVLFTILLTGCNSSEEKILYMEYDETRDVSAITSGVNNGNNGASLMATDLCVIPVGEDKGGDSNITSSASLFVNITDNKTVYSENIYSKLYPASITKVATALTVLNHANLSDTVTFSSNAAGITESGAKLCGFSKGDQIQLKDLLTAMLVYSGNDAGVALAEHVSGSVEEFCKLMTSEVHELGAVNTNFVNPHGLHNDNHYTTAYDIYLIFNEALKNDKFKEICGLKSYTVKYKTSTGANASKTFETTNMFLLGTKNAPEGISVLGGKTGTTNKAGSCLVLYSKDKNNKEYISVLLKNTSSNELYNQMAHMLGLFDD